MLKLHPQKTLMPILFFSVAIVCGYTHANAETFEKYLDENESARVRYENCNPDQRQEMEHRWAIFNERYNSLSLEEQEKINAMRRERESRWRRLSKLGKAEMINRYELDLETCIAEHPFQECNI